MKFIPRLTGTYTMQTVPNRIPQRVVLYTRDVENITGRRGRTARQLLQKIRTALGKSKDEFITIKEFSLFTGIDEELIKDFLQS
ncbi:hypothetical protein ESA94_09430 [Lacibacter luteus]|uniref:Uncharacterized protein n=1 Tax=Lacibacter luteus TaxID=2508719 RepID=A0A4V1M7N3_9BACT|nr:hypothetical protein [Lacibacter luteus]RXK60675.1 hypothetical protein ESA94_09430 [Lacibacter luteus]